MLILRKDEAIKIYGQQQWRSVPSKTERKKQEKLLLWCLFLINKMLK